jgi:hypothetical protein
VRGRSPCIVLDLIDEESGPEPPRVVVAAKFFTLASTMLARVSNGVVFVFSSGVSATFSSKDTTPR